MSQDGNLIGGLKYVEMEQKRQTKIDYCFQKLSLKKSDKVLAEY